MTFMIFIICECPRPAFVMKGRQIQTDKYDIFIVGAELIFLERHWFVENISGLSQIMTYRETMKHGLIICNSITMCK